jgi:hypothetical protein
MLLLMFSRLFQLLMELDEPGHLIRFEPLRWRLLRVDGRDQRNHQQQWALPELHDELTRSVAASPNTQPHINRWSLFEIETPKRWTRGDAIWIKYENEKKKSFRY